MAADSERTNQIREKLEAVTALGRKIETATTRLRGGRLAAALAERGEYQGALDLLLKLDDGRREERLKRAVEVLLAETLA